MQDKISLAGDLGSGKSTVAKILVEQLGMEYYSTGSICRAVAARHGMTVVEMNQYMETHPELDKEIDDGLCALSDVDKPLLIDSRMAWHFVRDTFKVYLSTELAVSAARIFGADRSEEKFATVEETEQKIRERRDSEKKRYMEFYGVNNKDLANYHLVLDTTYATPGQVADYLIDSFRVWQGDRGKHFCYVSPLRLYYPAEMPDDAPTPAAMAEEIEAGVTPMVEVTFDGDRFLVVGNAPAALGYALTDQPLVPCVLTKKEATGEYVRMADSL